ncbi:hypothetical protein D1AOALGA4SA_13053 [Olavius algarvensis Delta 1 endosymbiont]|nr:hypothetical protein D1AOALGA4SA_13053 [Olavius algarvensis Delta 1 endosymbiont]
MIGFWLALVIVFGSTGTWAAEQIFIEWTHKRKNSHYISMIR